MTVGALCSAPPSNCSRTTGRQRPGERGRARESCEANDFRTARSPRPLARSGSRPSRRTAASRSAATPWSPIVADGALIAYSKQDEDPRQLDGKMVVVWLDDQPTVRWFRHLRPLRPAPRREPRYRPPAAAHRPRRHGRPAPVPARPLDRYAPLIRPTACPSSRDRLQSPPAIRRLHSRAAFTSSGSPPGKARPAPSRRRSVPSAPGPRSP